MQKSGLARTEAEPFSGLPDPDASGAIRAGSAAPPAASWSPQRWDRRRRRSRMWRARSTWRDSSFRY